MISKLIKRFGFAIGCLLAILTFIAIVALSWAITCGLVYLITLCFGWSFSWGIGTGIWLVMILINGGLNVVKREVKK